MNRFATRALSLVLGIVLLCSLFVTASAKPAGQQIITTPTGYTKASDVVYNEVTDQFYDPVASKTVTKTIVSNWGARGEVSVFLSSYATAFYGSCQSFDVLSQLKGSHQQNQVPSSALFQALQQLMESHHTYFTQYKDSKNVRDFYMYTDCVSNDTTQVSVLYRGDMVTSKWNSGDIWNQEHTWPQSKCTSDWQVGDIMQLRPSNPSENSSRGNDCYGEKKSSGYYDPGVSVRGDCARMALYMYVRWGNTSKMWGSGGVMESVDILLKWMEEDPVDTWEMGRNDAVQTITGTRNVFVDYPELAWLLFDKSVPSNMTTPSGSAKEGSSSTPPVAPCTHSATQLQNQKDATCTADGYTGDKVCVNCSATVESGTVIPAGHRDENEDYACDACQENLCSHSDTKLQGEKNANCTEEGYTGDKVCSTCGHMIEEGHVLSKTEHTQTIINQKDATCGENGYTGDKVCSDCTAEITKGTVIPSTGKHNLGQWVTSGDLQERSCADCGYKQTQELPPRDNTGVIVVTVIAAAATVFAAASVLMKKRKKT